MEVGICATQHFALKVSGVAGRIVNCFDVNIVANAVYKHNFDIEPIKVIVGNSERVHSIYVV